MSVRVTAYRILVIKPETSTPIMHVLVLGDSLAFLVVPEIALGTLTLRLQQ